MLGTYNTCVRLQSRITSYGAAVNSWMILFILAFYYWCYYYYCLFVCLLFLSLFFCLIRVSCYYGLFVDVSFQVCVVVVIVLACFCFWGQGQGVVFIICWSVNYRFFGTVYKFVVSQGVCLSVYVCGSMHGYVLPVCVRNLIVNIWGPQMMRAYIFLGFLFLEIRKKD